MQSARLPKFVPDPFAQRQGSPALTAAYSFTDRSELDKINWAGSQIEDRAYDAVGLMTGVDRPGVDETRAYDALNRVTSIGNTNVGDGTYTYDANSNKLSESWSGAMAAWNFITTNAGANPQGYDAEDRFTNFIQSGQSKTLGLTRSDIGNISNINLNGTNTARGYSNIHALTSIGSTNQVFDTDGNLTNAQTGIDLAWDEAGMMKETIVGTGDTAGIEGTNTYGYDADRKRVWKKRMLESSTNEHTVYIHAGPNVIAEYPAGTAAASPTQEYVYGQEIDSLVLLVRSTGGGSGNEKLTITRNQQWSVTALSDATSGNILERYTYDHFGKRTILEPNGSTVRNTSSYNMPFGYTSRQHDAETGLLFMRARYYDHLTGEFIAPDPLEYIDGMSLFRGYFIPNGVDPSGLDDPWEGGDIKVTGKKSVTSKCTWRAANEATIVMTFEVIVELKDNCNRIEFPNTCNHNDDCQKRCTGNVWPEFTFRAKRENLNPANNHPIEIFTSGKGKPIWVGGIEGTLESGDDGDTYGTPILFGKLVGTPDFLTACCGGAARGEFNVGGRKGAPIITTSWAFRSWECGETVLVVALPELGVGDRGQHAIKCEFAK